MELTELPPTIIERLLVLEERAAHATVMAAVAEHLHGGNGMAATNKCLAQNNKPGGGEA